MSPLTRADIATAIRRLPPGVEQIRALQAFKVKYGNKPLPPAQLFLTSLRDYVPHVWPVVEPSKPLAWNWHLDELCAVLESVSRGHIKRLIINVPPGTGKSLLVSVLWPSWEWQRDPAKRFLTFSYSDVNTIRDNRRLRAIVTSDWYRRNSNVVLSSDQQAKIRFDTTATGWRIASSVGGLGTGEHPHYIIIDDPLKAADARSPTAIANCNDWFDRTIPTRVSLDPAMIVIMQRLHMDDLTGHLLAKGGWHHVCFPMRFDPDSPDPRDRRAEPGELLWPDQWPEEKVRQEEIALGPFGTAGQLGQKPVPEGGGLFKREWFVPVDAAPVGPLVRRCRGWDTADTEGGGNWTAGVRLSVTPEGLWYVEHVERAQSGPGGVSALIKTTADVDGKKTLIREGSGSGKATIAARSKLLVGYDYAPMPETTATGDKVTRANPFRAQCEAGNVRMVRGPWNEAYLSVMTSFPVGKYDDDVDATANAFNALVQTEPKKSKATWGKPRLPRP